MLRRKFIYYIAVILSLIGFLISNDRWTLILFAILVISGIFSLAILYLGKGLEMNMNFQTVKSSSVNKIVMMKVTVFGKKVLPLQTMKIVLSYENSLYQEKVQKVFFIRPGSNEVNEYQWEWEHFDCGNYTIKTDKIILYDLFGIWSIRLNNSDDLRMISYPSIPEFEIGQSNDTKTGYEGDHYDRYHSGHDVSEVFDLREYKEGDAIGSIHWKLSSKMDKLIIREFGSPSNDQTTVFSDMAFLDYRNNHSLVNGVLGITIAFSQALIRAGIVHHIAAVRSGELQHSTVNTQSESLDVVSDMLSMHLADAEDAYKTLKYYLTTDRVIIITGALQEDMFTELAERTNLTVILLTEGDKEYIEEKKNFRILALPLKQLDEKIHQIDI